MSQKCKILGLANSPSPIEINQNFNSALLKQDGNNTNFVKNAGYFMQLASKHARENNMPLCLSTLVLGVRAFPDDPILWHQLGRKLYFDRQFKHSVTALKKAKELDPTINNISTDLQGAINHAEALQCNRT